MVIQSTLDGIEAAELVTSSVDAEVSEFFNDPAFLSLNLLRPGGDCDSVTVIGGTTHACGCL